MSDDRVLRIERRYSAPPEAVFDAFTDPEQIAEWWGPEGMHVPEFAFEARVGGAWATTMENADGQQFHVSGVYTAVDRPGHLAFTWAWRQEDGSRGHETVVDITFAAFNDGTLLTLVQRSFETAEQRDNHRGGWMSSFNDLERYLGARQLARHS